MKPKSPPGREIVALTDLVPTGEIKGGTGKRVFGAGAPAMPAAVPGRPKPPVKSKDRK